MEKESLIDRDVVLEALHNIVMETIETEVPYIHIKSNKIYRKGRGNRDYCGKVKPAKAINFIDIDSTLDSPYSMYVSKLEGLLDLTIVNRSREVSKDGLKKVWFNYLDILETKFEFWIYMNYKEVDEDLIFQINEVKYDCLMEMDYSYYYDKVVQSIIN